jgi:hypothetical protein
MEFTVELGAKADLVTKGELDDGIAGLKHDIFSQRKPRPIFSSAIASSVIDATGRASLDLGSPAVGRIWNVTGYTAFGADDNTVVANAKLAVYFGDPDQVGIMGLIAPNLALPSSDAWGEKVYWCHSSENVIGVVSGTGIAGTQVGLKIYYADWPEAAVAGHSGK